MAKAGRKRRAGRREPNGRLQRPKVAELRYDRGTEQAQAIQALYGTDGTDAIGRAYRAGLLGEGNEAKTLLDTARKVASLYWRAYTTGPITCAIADKTFGSVVDLDHERIRRNEEWLAETLRSIDRMGRDVRRAFDQLCIDVHPDSGPCWIDRLIYAERTGGAKLKTDTDKLRAALDALENAG